MVQQTNRWKWQFLRIGALVESVYAVLILSGLLFSIQGVKVRWWSQDFWVIILIASWGLQVLFANYWALKSVSIITKSNYNEEFKFSNRTVLVALFVATLALIIYGIMLMASLYAFLDMQKLSTKPLGKGFYYTFGFVGFFLLLELAVYLVSISAYFQLQYLRRKQQEDILHAIGNPHFLHHS